MDDSCAWVTSDAGVVPGAARISQPTVSLPVGDDIWAMVMPENVGVLVVARFRAASSWAYDSSVADFAGVVAKIPDAAGRIAASDDRIGDNGWALIFCSTVAGDSAANPVPVVQIILFTPAVDTPASAGVSQP